MVDESINELIGQELIRYYDEQQEQEIEELGDYDLNKYLEED